MEYMLTDALAARIPRVKRKEPQYTSKSVYVMLSVWNRLGAIAHELGRSRSSLVAGILADWVAAYDAGDIERPDDPDQK